jgi:hypothetical protein
MPAVMQQVVRAIMKVIRIRPDFLGVMDKNDPKVKAAIVHYRESSVQVQSCSPTNYTLKKQTQL